MKMHVQIRFFLQSFFRCCNNQYPKRERSLNENLFDSLWLLIYCVSFNQIEEYARISTMYFIRKYLLSSYEYRKYYFFIITLSINVPEISEIFFITAAEEAVLQLSVCLSFKYLLLSPLHSCTGALLLQLIIDSFICILNLLMYSVNCLIIFLSTNSQPQNCSRCVRTKLKLMSEFFLQSLALFILGVSLNNTTWRLLHGCVFRYFATMAYHPFIHKCELLGHKSFI